MFGIGAIAVATKGSARMGSFCVVKSTRLDTQTVARWGRLSFFHPFGQQRHKSTLRPSFGWMPPGFRRPRWTPRELPLWKFFLARRSTTSIVRCYQVVAPRDDGFVRFSRRRGRPYRSCHRIQVRERALRRFGHVRRLFLCKRYRYVCRSISHSTQMLVAASAPISRSISQSGMQLTRIHSAQAYRRGT
jgi:hypothetical protein